ncbi:hypothetical protein Leryth_000135, partial [Lithospermum erythrorhizon]
SGFKVFTNQISYFRSFNILSHKRSSLDLPKFFMIDIFIFLIQVKS